MRYPIALLALLAAFTASQAGATTTKLDRYKREEVRHEQTLAFFAHRPWMTVPSERYCWQATGWHRRKVCRIARREVSEHRARLENVRRMIAKLSTVSGPVGNVAAWTCIHSHEAAWDQIGYVHGVPTYYGGLQMDWEFMSTYGPELLRAKGPATNWTPTEQMIVAERARASGRGYWPWPNTARTCGLL